MPPSARQRRFFCSLRIAHSDKMEPLKFLEFFVKAARLLWAQEVSGSNPDAPTKTSRVFSSGY